MKPDNAGHGSCNPSRPAPAHGDPVPQPSLRGTDAAPSSLAVPDTQAECVSALVDGELSGLLLAQTIEALAEDPARCATWGVYHLAGEALRMQSRVGSQLGDPAFARRIRTLIEADLAVVAAQWPTSVPGPDVPPRAPDGLKPIEPMSQPAANDAVWRWRLAAAVASLVAVVALGLNLGGLEGRPIAATLAQPTGLAPGNIQRVAAGAAGVWGSGLAVAPGGGGVRGDGAPPVLLRDPEIDRLLMAHRPFGTGLGEAVSADGRGVMRVTFEAPVR